MKKPPFASLLAAMLLAASVVSCTSKPPSNQSIKTAESVSAEERIVQTQLEAYNRHDIDAFVATYAPGVRGYLYPDHATFVGLDSLRAGYAHFFATAPAVRATVLRRIVQGRYVIDHEELTGLPDGRTQRAVAIYEVRDGLIATVRFLR
jgi:hypothetical protein